jgi:hypothetical protein
VMRAEAALAEVPKDDEPVARVKQAAKALPIPSGAPPSRFHERFNCSNLIVNLTPSSNQTARFRRVPSTYYEWPLARRRRCLGAPSVHQVRPSVTTFSSLESCA